MGRGPIPPAALLFSLFSFLSLSLATSLLARHSHLCSSGFRTGTFSPEWQVCRILTLLEASGEFFLSILSLPLILNFWKRKESKGNFQINSEKLKVFCICRQDLLKSSDCSCLLCTAVFLLWHFQNLVLFCKKPTPYCFLWLLFPKVETLGRKIDLASDQRTWH